MDLIEKDDDGSYFIPSNIKADESSFIIISKERINESKVYSELLKSPESILSTKKVAGIYKNCFDYTSTNDETWHSYATTLIQWIYFLELDIKDKILNPERGRKGGVGLDKSKDYAIILNNPENIIITILNCPNKSVHSLLTNLHHFHIKQLRQFFYFRCNMPNPHRTMMSRAMTVPVVYKFSGTDAETIAAVGIADF